MTKRVGTNEAPLRSCPSLSSELQIEIAREAAVVVGVVAARLVDVERVLVHRAQTAAVGHQHAAGGLACLGVDTRAAAGIEALHPGGVFGRTLHLAGDDDAHHSALVQQPGRTAEEHVVVQAAGMAGGVALAVGTGKRVDEVRRVGDDEVVARGGLEVAEICTDHTDAVGPGRGGNVLGRLRGGIGIDLDGRHLKLGVALGQLQGYEARTCAYVERRADALHRGPRAQQHAVGAHLHGAAVVADDELFEQKG